MDPLQPRPAIVHQVQDQGRENCIGLYKMAVKHDTQSLETAVALGKSLIAYKQRVPHGQWKAELEAMGIPGQRAWECMKIALFETTNAAKVRELGSKTAVLRHIAQNPMEDRYAEECGIEEPEEQISGTGDLKTGGGPATGKRKRPGKAGSPSSKQQSLPMDQQEAQERLEKDMRRFLRGLAEEVKDMDERLQCKLRLDTRAAAELRDLAGTRGPMFQIVKVAAPEPAAGFEEKQEPDRYEWRVLTALLNVLAQVGGKEE